MMAWGNGEEREKEGARCIIIKGATKGGRK